MGMAMGTAGWQPSWKHNKHTAGWLEDTLWLLRTLIKGHPFMMSTRRAKGVRLRWTDTEGRSVSAPCVRPHKNLNPVTSSCLLLVQRSWRLILPEFRLWTE